MENDKCKILWSYSRERKRDVNSWFGLLVGLVLLGPFVFFFFDWSPFVFYYFFWQSKFQKLVSNALAWAFIRNTKRTTMFWATQAYTTILLGQITQPWHGVQYPKFALDTTNPLPIYNYDYYNSNQQINPPP